MTAATESALVASFLPTMATLILLTACVVFLWGRRPGRPGPLRKIGGK